VIRRTLADLLAAREAADRPYLEFVREDSMSVGLYVLPPGGVDNQTPHDEDEVYVVLRGRARFTAGDVTVDVAPTDTLYVPAQVPHRFHDITEELALAVVFAPPES
jgi:mannose-6-phosphate isomerase-like protein (cupin superfamily)